MRIPDIDRPNNIPTSTVGIFVKWWNINYPLDRWFRERHSIIWGSESHRSKTLLSMYFEYQEYLLFQEQKRPKQKYISGDWYKSEGSDIEEVETEDLFDNIDISKLDGDTLNI